MVAVEVNGYTIEPGADLYEAVLTGAALTRANLDGANLTGVDLSGANLEVRTSPGRYGDARFLLGIIRLIVILASAKRTNDYG